MYPSPADKRWLARTSGMTVEQINNWVRLCSSAVSISSIDSTFMQFQNHRSRRLKTVHNADCSLSGAASQLSSGDTIVVSQGDSSASSGEETDVELDNEEVRQYYLFSENYADRPLYCRRHGRDRRRLLLLVKNLRHTGSRQNIHLTKVFILFLQRMGASFALRLRHSIGLGSQLQIPPRVLRPTCTISFPALSD